MPRSVRSFRCVILLASIALIPGCDSASIMNRLSNAEDKAAAEHYVDLLRQQKFEELESVMDTGLHGDDIPDKLATMAALIPPQNPLSIKLVGSHTLKGSGFTRSDITLEYQFPQKWLLINVVTTKRDEGTFITGFFVTPTADSLQNLNRFTFVNKGLSQYVLLLLAVAMMFFSLYAFILCIKTKIAKRKWLWVLATLVGIGQVSVNWTSGRLNLSLITIHLPPFGASEELYSPWIIYSSSHAANISVSPFSRFQILLHQCRPKTPASSPCLHARRAQSPLHQRSPYEHPDTSDRG